jgi:hypothetical protein
VSAARTATRVEPLQEGAAEPKDEADSPLASRGLSGAFGAPARSVQ